MKKMMMINSEIPPPPCPPMSTFDAPCRTVTPCPSPSMERSRKTLAPKEEQAEQSPSKKRRCRKVGFGPDRTLAYIESSIEITQEEKDDRWYRPSEISSFKENARSLCRTRMQDAKHSSADASIPRHTSRKSVSVAVDCDFDNEASGDSIRGLDVYYPSRQRYCKKFIKHVLEAYYVRCVGNDQHVALLAEKWSRKSLVRATDTAKKDFLVAYFSEDVQYQSNLEEKVVLASTMIHGSQNQQAPILATTA